jgi:hypothetical protein
MEGARFAQSEATVSEAWVMANASTIAVEIPYRALNEMPSSET